MDHYHKKVNVRVSELASVNKLPVVWYLFNVPVVDIEGLGWSTIETFENVLVE